MRRGAPFLCVIVGVAGCTFYKPIVVAGEDQVEIGRVHGGTSSRVELSTSDGSPCEGWPVRVINGSRETNFSVSYVRLTCEDGTDGVIFVTNMDSAGGLVSGYGDVLGVIGRDRVDAGWGGLQRERRKADLGAPATEDGGAGSR